MGRVSLSARKLEATLLMAATAAIALAGCASLPPQAALPPHAQARDAAKDQALYQDFSLVYEEQKGKWRRNDGAYSYPELGDVFEAYPETREKKSSASLRGNAIVWLSGASGAIAGAVTSYHLSAPAGKGLSGPALGASYGVAGGLIVLAFIILAATDNPLATIATTYNEALGRDLGLPSPASTPASTPAPTPAPMSAIDAPRAATTFELGYTVHF